LDAYINYFGIKTKSEIFISLVTPTEAAIYSLKPLKEHSNEGKTMVPPLILAAHFLKVSTGLLI